MTLQCGACVAKCLAEKGMAKGEAVALVSRAIARTHGSADAGMGLALPPLSGGVPLIALGAIASGIGWTLRILKGA